MDEEWEVTQSEILEYLERFGTNDTNETQNINDTFETDSQTQFGMYGDDTQLYEVSLLEFPRFIDEQSYENQNDKNAIL